MKKSIAILVLGMLPALALAADDHAAHTSHSATEAAHDADGHAGDPAKAARTIEVSLNDTMRVTPDRIEVKAGETVRFQVKNTGKMPHEMVIGSMSELKEHAEEMRANPGMKHDEPGMLRLEAGKQGEIVWEFDERGSTNFACLAAGHLEAGMVGKIEIK